MNVRALFFVMALAPAALADTPPSRWDSAKNPQVQKDWEAHLEAQRNFALADELHLRPGGRNLDVLYLERARVILEDAKARTSNDVRLRFDYGICLQHLHNYVEAAEVLKEALAMAPTHPTAIGGANPAWLAYSIASAYLENSEEERKGYEQFLAHATEGLRRLIPMLNLSEAAMHLNDMTEAVQGYREVLQLSASLPNTETNVETAKLAKWGLAVALDRSGDFGAAQAAAKAATEMDPPPTDTGTYAMRAPLRRTTILDELNVFFVPAYERKWYLALGETALAKGSSDPRVALEHWRGVEQLWTEYVTGARAHAGGDRWLAVAEKRLEATKKKRQEFEARVGTMKTPSSRSTFIE